MRKSVLLVASFSTMAMLLTGCQSSLTGDSYSRDEARRVQTIRMGTIESLRPVKIEGTKTPIGGAAGAVVGGVGGSAIGGGRGSIVAAVIGAVAGGLIGSATEEGLTRTQGVEITVREDDGSMRAYVQQVQVVMALEEEFETEIPDEEAEKITTVQAAIDYVTSHQA